MAKRPVLMALPTLACLGAIVPGVGSLFGFRLLVIALGLFALVNKKESTKGLATVFAFRAMVAVWAIVALMASFFITDFSAGVRATLSLFIGFVLIYALIHARDPATALENLQRGWVVAYVVTGAIAMRELLTGTHLANYYSPLEGSVRGAAPYIASTFGNPNAYAAFLVTAFPFLAYGLLKSGNWYERYAHAGMILALPVLLLQTGSRLCLMALAIEAVFLAVYAGEKYRKPLVTGILLVALVFFSVGAGVADSLSSYLPGSLSASAPSNMIREVLAGGAETSGGVRLAVYRDGLWMIGESAGLGVGPGAFQTVMSSGTPPYDAGGIVDPHNLYLEIAAQYGLLVFALFAAWILTLARFLWRPARAGADAMRQWGTMMSAALLGNGVSALASSTYLAPSVNWVFFACLALVAVEAERRAPGRMATLPRPSLHSGRLGRGAGARRPALGGSG